MVFVSNLAPIVLFVFARPNHTRQTLQALSANVLAQQSDLIIYSDAARNKTEEKSVSDVRELINATSGFRSVTVNERETNYGLARNIIEGVTEVCARYGRVIVLEDDIETSKYFLTFMNAALDKYEDEPHVWHISGWNYPIDSDGLGNVFFWRVMNCWGWATWSDRWAKFERKPGRLIQNWSRKMIYRFNLDGVHNFWSQVKANHVGRLNTWAIFWYAAIFERNGLCLHPSVSLVHNAGHDGSGENCGNVKTFDSTLSARENWLLDIELEESGVATDRIKMFYKQARKSFVQRMALRFANIGRKIKQRVYS